MVQPTLQKMSLKEAHESFSSDSRGPIHEDQRLQIEELDEWQTYKPRTPNKPKLRQNELDTSPNQLKAGDKVLLNATDPHIVTTTPNEEIPVMVLNIFPFGMVEVSHPQFGTFKKSVVPASKKRKEASSSAGPTAKIHHPLLQFPRGAEKELFQILRALYLIVGRCIDWAAIEQVQMTDAIRALLTTDPWELFFGIIEPTYLELTMEICSTFHLSTTMTRYDDPGTIQFRLGGLIHQLSVLEFGAALGLYTVEFREENELHALSRHIHVSPLKCWNMLAPNTTSYNPSHSKASVLPPSLRYLHAILAHTITERRESTGVVNTHDVYFLWCMLQGHVITLAIQHQTERHRKGMSPQRISSMLNMRMIERRQGTYPPQYHFTQSIEEEAYEDIPDDFRHSMRTHRLSHHHPLVQFMQWLYMLTSLSASPDSSIRVFNDLTTLMLPYSRFICQYLHISSPVPPREPSSDEDV
ncbi:hypothetical protein GOBAR_AA28579 [Gossypium barbadense]|uniref:Arabidopsis retrotransposon Orf1 C-terminal domain-containing protein n=1 Tax=Gossypium barbadense TaxID=3634 RepID=A0A2P5WLW6_GOSBA|nr:hypothetical protein GOBAR_AA28579 [Gossypium barbadense]